jgi:glycosyltransferase involved in cell wall biosynthesis
MTHLAINGRFLVQDVTGVQRVAMEFVRALDSLLAEDAYHAFQVELVAPARGDLVTLPRLEVVRLRRAGRLSGHLWEQFELPGLVGRIPLLCLGNVAPLARLATRSAPVFTMVHDLSYKYFPASYTPAFRALYQVLVPAALARSAHVFTVSETERTSIRRHYGHLVGDERLTAVQNGGGEPARRLAATARLVAGSGSPEQAGVAARERRCLYVGSLTRRKNAEGLVRAAIDLARQEDLDFEFVGATGAGLEDVGLHIPADVESRIRFLGQVNDPATVAEHYLRASVLLFPSFYEASPLPPVEAMALGCPVVAADIPSLRERCGDAALYCDPADVGSMVRQVSRLVNDPDLWREQQQRGFQQAATYSWRTQVGTVLDTIGRAT